MVRVRRLGVVRTATVASVVYLLITLIILLPFVLVLATAGPITITDQAGRTTTLELSPFVLLLLPFVYALIGWVLTALSCLIYNLAAAITGGAELELVGEIPAGGIPTGGTPAVPAGGTPVAGGRIG